MAWGIPVENAPKIGILIPIMGPVSLEWSVAFAQLLANTPGPVEVFTDKHFCIDYSRNDLVEMALAAKCTKLMFLDSDLLPYFYDLELKRLRPLPQAIHYLASRDYPIVSGLYWTKKGHANVFIRDPKNIWASSTLKGTLADLADCMMYVDAVGIGFCLVDARVFERVPYPWFHYVRGKEKVEGRFPEISEDLYFCYKAGDHGYKVMVSGAVICKHEGRVFTTWENEAESQLRDL